jgi:hypothetical protein
VHLTAKGRGLKADLIPLAREVVSIAVQSLSGVEIKELLLQSRRDPEKSARNHFAT